MILFLIYLQLGVTFPLVALDKIDIGDSLRMVGQSPAAPESDFPSDYPVALLGVVAKNAIQSQKNTEGNLVHFHVLEQNSTGLRTGPKT